MRWYQTVGFVAVVAGCASSTSSQATESESAGTVPGASFASTAARRDEASLAVLREALASSDYATRLIAVEVLGDVNIIEAVPWLEHALGDPEHDVRMAAVESLGRLGTVASRAALASVRDDKSEDLDVRALAASALISPPRRGDLP